MSDASRTIQAAPERRLVTESGYVIVGACVVDVYAPNGEHLGFCAEGDVSFLIRDHKDRVTA